MDFLINNSPELSMIDITKKLFNNKYLSDIQFSIGGEIIYAHSLELMKRSLVFQRQLESTVGERKLILIDEVKFKSFLQFVQFIYTDNCEISLANGFELLKLAVTYKVIRLENILIDFLFRDDLSVQLALLQFCVIENYQAPFNRIADIIAYNFSAVLKSPLFVTLQPEALEAILKFNRIEEGVTETELFAGVVRWINHYCTKTNIKVSDRHSYFQRFIRQIRFPVMSDQEILNCVRTSTDLFTDSDCASFYWQMANGCNERNSLWNSQRRLPVYNPLEVKIFPCKRNDYVVFETKFIVANEMILTGIRYGNDIEVKSNEIKITERNNKAAEVANVVKFKLQLDVNWGSSIVSLGDSLKVKPNKEYTIGIYYAANSQQKLNITCRCPNDKIRVIDSSNSVKILASGANMIEIFFKQPL